MVLNKLREALAEINSERSNLAARLIAIEDVEIQLRAMIAKLSDAELTDESRASRAVPPFTPRTASSGGVDRIDQIVDILRGEGRPLHITKIVDRLSAVAAERVDRTNVEPGLNRHIQKVKNPRLQKFGPSIFGLPEWKTDQETPLLEDRALIAH